MPSRGLLRLWPSCLLALAVAAGAEPGAQARLDGWLQGLTTARADFEQTRYDETGTAVEVARGTFLLSRPGRFRWDYVEPYEQSIVGDGERVWIWDRDLEQVTVKDADAALGGTPALLLGADVDLAARFDLALEPPSGGLDWVALAARGEESEFTDVRLGFRGEALAVMELEDGFGQVTRIVFAGFERNAKVEEAAFRFVPPAGVDVIEAADAPSGPRPP